MQRVSNNNERKQNYRREYKRYEVAIKYGFYLEAIAISYAIIEDRLVSFLHYAGIVSRDQDKLKVNTAVYPHMRKLLGRTENSGIRVKNVSVKVRLIRSLMDMSEEKASEIDSWVKEYRIENRKKGIAKEGYMLDLYHQINKTIDKEKVIAFFKEFDTWSNDRNKLTHALLNNTAESIENTKIDCAEKGYSLSRKFDDYIAKSFKSKNNLRKKYKIQ